MTVHFGCVCGDYYGLGEFTLAAAQTISVAPRDQQEIEQTFKLYRSLPQEGPAALVVPMDPGLICPRPYTKSWRGLSRGCRRETPSR
jgi:hypothetical protein